MGADAPFPIFPLPSRLSMLRFLKKRWKKIDKKSINSSQNTLPVKSLTPMQSMAGTLAVTILRETSDETDGADKTMGSGVVHEGGSRTVTQDGRTGDQLPPAPNAPTLIPGHGSGDASECSRRLLLGSMFILPLDSTTGTGTHTWGLCGSEQLDRRTPDLHSDQRDSYIRNRGEHEDQGPVGQHPSETTPERTPGGDVHDLVQSRKSGGESRYSGYT